MTDPVNNREEFWTLVDGFSIAMVTTTDDGFMRARPMAPYTDRDTGMIRFLTRKSSHKVNELLADPRACVTFASSVANDFVSASGMVSISQDKEKIAEMWGPAADIWFPESEKSDDIAVLEFTPHHAQYWDGTMNVLKVAWEIAKASASKDHVPDLGDVRKVDFGR